MALFEGEEMVSVTTPDGRTITVPRSLSGMAPQQQIAPPSAPGVTPMQVGPAPTGFADEDTIANVAPAVAPHLVPPAGVVEEGEPDVVAVQNMEPEVIQASPKRMNKMRKQQAAQAASPQGQIAAAKGEQQTAARAQVDAITAMTDVDAATNDLVHGALLERNEALAKAENDRNVEMLARAQEQEKKMNEVVGLRKKIEGTKIDRAADHPVLAAVFAALAGLGSAMKGEKVDTLDILYKAVDRKVAAQQADLDQMGKVYGMTKEEVEMLKEKSKNRLEFHNAMIAAETNKAIRVVEELTARSASEKTRANGQMLIAGLRERAADKTMEATRWGLEYDQRAKAEQNQNNRFYSDLGFRKMQHADSMQIRREEIAAEMAKALANTKATGSIEEYKMQLEAAKEARQFGVRDMNGEFLLTPAGKAAKAEADKLEADIAKLESNPDVMARSIASDKIRAMRDRAAIIRNSLTTGVYAAKAQNETQSISISNQISSGQTIAQLIDSIKDLSNKAGRGAFTRDEAQVRLRAMFAQLPPELKDAWQLGAWDKGSAGLVTKVIGLDPSSEWNAGVLAMFTAKQMYEDPKAFQEGLDSVVENLDRKVKNRLVGIGTKFDATDTVLRREAQPAPLSDSAVKLSAARSGLELDKDAEHLGALSAIPLDRNQGSLRYPGLHKTQEPLFEERLQAYTKKGDRQAGDELVLAVKTAIEDNRPDLAVPLLHALRDNAPKELYKAARAAVPKDSEVDKQMTSEENMQIAPAVTPPATLFQQVLGSIKADGTIGDTAGWTEITKLATMPGPYQEPAKKAWAEIVKQSGHNKSLPRGSVFNKGAR